MCAWDGTKIGAGTATAWFAASPRRPIPRLLGTPPGAPSACLLPHAVSARRAPGERGAGPRPSASPHPGVRLRAVLRTPGLLPSPRHHGVWSADFVHTLAGFWSRSVAFVSVQVAALSAHLTAARLLCLFANASCLPSSSDVHVPCSARLQGIESVAGPERSAVAARGHRHMATAELKRVFELPILSKT